VTEYMFRGVPLKIITDKFQVTEIFTSRN